MFAKNLFVKDKKAGCFLLTVAHDTAVNMKSLPALLKTPGAAFRFADEKTHACYPCGHMCLCEECATELQWSTCPMCRADASGGLFRVWF